MPAPISGLARITIRAPRRRLDLSVPAQVPLAELLPDVVARAGEAGGADRPAGGWMLRRGDGGSLVGEAALAHQGVRDGDVLYLVPRQMAWPEPAYDDVIEEVAADARANGHLWSTAATRLFALAGVGVVLLAGLAAVLTSAGTASGDIAGAVAVVAALLLVGTGALVSRALGDGPAGAVAGAGAALYAAAGAALLTSGTGTPAAPVAANGASQLLLAGSALVLASVVASVAVGYGLRVFAAGVVAGLLTTVGALVAHPLGAPGAAAILSVVLIAGIGLAPLVAVRLGRLPLPIVTAAPQLIATERRPDRAQLRAAVVRADEILSGALLGLSVVGLGCVNVLAATTGVAGRLLALLAAFSLLLRARLFPSVAARLPLLAAGTAGLVLTVVAALPTVGAATRLVAAGLGVAVVVGLLATATLARRPRGAGSPYLARLADVADVGMVVALAPVACAVLGLFAWVRAVAG